MFLQSLFVFIFVTKGFVMMKPTHVLLMLLLYATVLSSCGPVRDRRTLDEVETLMPERPDSALAVLRGMKPRDLPGLHVRPLHALLLSEALDKNYIDLTDDSLALAANRHYGEHGSPIHRLKSWYYLGRIRFNNGNYAEAVIHYNKALEFAEALENYHYIGLVNREIGNAYSKVWDDYHSIEYTQKAIDAFKSAGEDRYTAYSVLGLATLYYRQKKNKECRQVLDELETMPLDRKLTARIAETRFFTSVSEGDKDYDRILSDFHSIGVGTVIPQTASQLARIAYVHEKNGQADSADYYMKRAENLCRTKSDSTNVEFGRYRIERHRGNLALADSLLEHNVYAQDSSVFAALAQSVSFYQGDYYHSESRLNAMKVRTRTMALGFTVLLLLILVLFLISRNRKQRERLMEEMDLAMDIRRELSAKQDEAEGMNKAIATLFENRLKILQTLSEQYDTLEDAYQGKKLEKGRELSREEIIASFREKMRDLRRNKDITLSMEETLDAWKDGIMRKFREVFSEDSAGAARMTDEDLDLAPYFFSGMNYKTISFFTGYSIASLRTRKSRIRQKIQELDDSFSLQKRLFLENL